MYDQEQKECAPEAEKKITSATFTAAATALVAFLVAVVGLAKDSADLADRVASPIIPVQVAMPNGLAGEQVRVPSPVTEDLHYEVRDRIDDGSGFFENLRIIETIPPGEKILHKKSGYYLQSVYVTINWEKRKVILFCQYGRENEGCDLVTGPVINFRSRTSNYPIFIMPADIDIKHIEIGNTVQQRVIDISDRVNIDLLYSKAVSIEPVFFDEESC